MSTRDVYLCGAGSVLLHAAGWNIDIWWISLPLLIVAGGLTGALMAKAERP